MRLSAKRALLFGLRGLNADFAGRGQAFWACGLRPLTGGADGWRGAFWGPGRPGSGAVGGRWGVSGGAGGTEESVRWGEGRADAAMSGMTRAEQAEGMRSAGTKRRMAIAPRCGGRAGNESGGRDRSGWPGWGQRAAWRGWGLWVAGQAARRRCGGRASGLEWGSFTQWKPNRGSGCRNRDSSQADRRGAARRAGAKRSGG